MSPKSTANILRGLFLFLLQALILRHVSLGWGQFSFIQVIIYPLFILMLPIKLPKASVVILAFLYGFTIDIFYHSPGVHASATLVLSIARPFLLNQLEPRGGYKVDVKPTRRDLGSNWFYRYVAYGLLIHLFAYFSVLLFSAQEIPSILLRTVCCLAPSYIFILLYTVIFDPRE